MLTDLLAAVQSQDQPHWYELLQAVEQHWFVPLLSALRQRRLDTLNILACDGRQFAVKRANLRYFWRRSHVLSHWL
ncbi:MAG: hypothetical protein R3F53_07125 [Gammaproteobacteria bacterium]